MSDSGEKRFEPTPSRIEKAKREGDTSRAGEFGANAAFAGCGYVHDRDRAVVR